MELLHELRQCNIGDHLVVGEYNLLYLMSSDELVTIAKIVESIDSLDGLRVSESRQVVMNKITLTLLTIESLQYVDNSCLIIDGMEPIIFRLENDREWASRLLDIISVENMSYNPRSSNCNHIDLDGIDCEEYDKSDCSELIHHNESIELLISCVRLSLGMEPYSDRILTYRIGEDNQVSEEDLYKIRCELAFSALVGMLPQPVNCVGNELRLCRNPVYMTRYMYIGMVPMNLCDYTITRWFNNSDPKSFILELPHWKYESLPHKVMRLAYRVDMIDKLSKQSGLGYMGDYIIHSIMSCLGFYQ